MQSFVLFLISMLDRIAPWRAGLCAFPSGKKSSMIHYGSTMIRSGSRTIRSGSRTIRSAKRATDGRTLVHMLAPIFGDIRTHARRPDVWLRFVPNSTPSDTRRFSGLQLCPALLDERTTNLRRRTSVTHYPGAAVHRSDGPPVLRLSCNDLLKICR
jgi:hypothetical protein